jgi:hypothetical protein
MRSFITNSRVHVVDATTVAVTVVGQRGLHRIDVHDDGMLASRTCTKGSPDAEDGRGFRLVNKIARRWGFTRSPDAPDGPKPPPRP